MAAAQAATEGRILSEGEVDPAASNQLAGELEVFESVAQGIALSLAVCDEVAGCDPMLSEDELAKLIETLDSRIDQLNSFEESAETAAGYDSLLNEYRQTRENYALYMKELRDIKRGVKEFAEEEIPAETTTEPEPAPSPEPEKAARVEPPPEPKQKFRNEEFDVDFFEDVDEPVRSE
ncbi:MAG: hypothetical protein U5P41_09775 [Gammaproteobacteria bacterium]|nr:hypothetical protein [Gammaproteobacteria bacterium]